MAKSNVGGYAGRLLRADLTSGQFSDATFDEPTLRKWIGGSGLGAKILYDEVPPEVQWDDPENRVIIASGPLGGTKVQGSGTISVITVGPMTGGSTTTQANGFLGAFMKFSGFDGIILQGRSEKWVYVYMHDGVAELRDATNLLGLDTWEMHEAIAEELGKKSSAISVFGVGPAGEHLVRFAAVAGDHGHVAGHNGSGAAMGSKRVKAVVAARTPGYRVRNEAKVSEAARLVAEAVQADPAGRNGFQWGTSMGYVGAERGGWLPTKNLTTSLFPQAPEFMGDRYRPAFNAKPSPCWACRSKHLHMLTIPDGPYKGFKGEEPEYEQWSAWGSVIGNTDVAGAVVLSNDVDRLGLENNEGGWVVGYAMECYEKGIITKEETGGLELTWGNVDAARALLRKIANREGMIGDLLAEGVKRASEKLGRGSEGLAVYTMKGNSPRGHDHRARWFEMLETSISDTGTIMVGPVRVGGPAKMDAFDPDQVSTLAAEHSGRMIFEDCLGTCRFCTRCELEPVANAVAAITGWDFTAEEGMEVGRRTLNLLRAFNLRRGLTPALEYPSKRYGSTPVDGPVAGKSVQPHWEGMRANYYRLMGWDLETGRPRPETLSALGLQDVAATLWG